MRPCSTSARASGQLPPRPLRARRGRRAAGRPTSARRRRGRPSPTARRRDPARPSRRRRGVCRGRRPRPGPRRAAGGCRPRRWRAGGPATTCPARPGPHAQASRSTRPVPSTPTSRAARVLGAAARARPGTRTAECSTAEATMRAPRRRAAYAHPVDGPGQRGRAAGQEAHLGGAHAEAGRDDLARAVEQRRAARRPSVCRRRGSAQPTSTAASRVSRATGCSGPAAASSRRRTPGRGRTGSAGRLAVVAESGRGGRCREPLTGATGGSNVRARIVTDHSATLAAPCGHRDKWDGRVAPWALLPRRFDVNTFDARPARPRTERKVHLVPEHEDTPAASPAVTTVVGEPGGDARDSASPASPRSRPGPQRLPGTGVQRIPARPWSPTAASGSPTSGSAAWIAVLAVGPSTGA